MSEKSAGTLHCKRCWKSLPIPSYDTVCELCGCREQCEMKVRCFQCFAYMSASTMECPSLYCKHNQSFRPTRRPCYLCVTLIPVNDLVCTHCKSPQDIEKLNSLSFKVCPNQSCRIILSVYTDFCYGCKQQQDPSVTGFPGSAIFKSGKPLCMQTSQELSDNIRGYTEIGNKVKGDNKPCILCKAPVPAYIDRCSVCLASQDIEILKKSKLKYCSHVDCGTVMSAELITCFKCKRRQDRLVLASIHVEDSNLVVIKKVSHAEKLDKNGGSKPALNQMPKKKTCLLCHKQIPESSQFCFTCQTSQDIETFKSCHFKQCSNSKCEKVLVFDRSICYSCQHVQGKPIAFILGASLYSQSSNATTASQSGTTVPTSDQSQSGTTVPTSDPNPQSQSGTTVPTSDQSQSGTTVPTSNPKPQSQSGTTVPTSDQSQSGTTVPTSDPKPQSQSGTTVPTSDQSQSGTTVPTSDPKPQSQSGTTVPTSNPKPQSQSGATVPTSDQSQSGTTVPTSDPKPQSQSGTTVPTSDQSQSGTTVPTSDPKPQSQSGTTVPTSDQSQSGTTVPTSDPKPQSQSGTTVPTSNPKPQSQSGATVPTSDQSQSGTTVPTSDPKPQSQSGTTVPTSDQSQSGTTVPTSDPKPQSQSGTTVPTSDQSQSGTTVPTSDPKPQSQSGTTVPTSDQSQSGTTVPTSDPKPQSQSGTTVPTSDQSQSGTTVPTSDPKPQGQGDKNTNENIVKQPTHQNSAEVCKFLYTV